MPDKLSDNLFLKSQACLDEARHLYAKEFYMGAVSRAFQSMVFGAKGGLSHGRHAGYCKAPIPHGLSDALKLFREVFIKSARCDLAVMNDLSFGWTAKDRADDTVGTVDASLAENVIEAAERVLVAVIEATTKTPDHDATPRHALLRSQTYG